MKNRIVLVTLASANLIIAGFIFTTGLAYAPHTTRNFSVGCLRLLVHIGISIVFLLMLREGGLRRRDGQILAVFLVFSVITYFVAVCA